MAMKKLDLNPRNIQSLPDDWIGYIGAKGYGFIRVFEWAVSPKEPEFKHRCWKGYAIFLNDADGVYGTALCDFSNEAEARVTGMVFHSRHGLTEEFARFACEALGIPFAPWVNTTPM
jgi:hypothetical protein